MEVIMKNKKSYLAIVVFLLSMLLSVSAYAADKISVSVNGARIETLVEPRIIDGRTMVPVRDIFNAVGADVEWHSQNNEIYASSNNTVVKMYLGSKEYYVNNVKYVMDCVPAVIDGRTLAPARYAAEAFGFGVAWDNATRTVIISNKADTNAESLKVSFFDVGQGDSILLQCNGSNILVDAGDTDKGQKVINYLKANSVDKLDYIVATHPHADHIGGIADVIKSYSVGAVIMPNVTTTTSCYKNMLTTIKEKGIKAIEPKAGDSYKLGGANITVLGPIKYDEKNLNSNSVVLKVEYAGYSLLLTGDADNTEEQAIIDSGAKLNADVLKVGHHGSATSSSEPFVNAVGAKYAVISVGTGNDYGHPTDSAMNRILKSGATIYRTDLNGTITMDISSSGRIEINTDKTENTAVTSADTTLSDSPILDKANSVDTNVTGTGKYVLNTKSKKIHYATCSSVASISANNIQEYNGLIDDILSQGYTSCGICKP
jgi:competence protein ComEC